MEPIQAAAAFARRSQPSYGLLLDKRQSGGQNGTTSVPSPVNNGQGGGGFNAGQGQAPLTVYTFIIAIALFVLVVSFVLLRIFVRNRRLRALGLYPESPIERLLGGAPREYEDTLPPPKLWDAKIADVRANNTGALARAEKSMLGGGVGAGDVKEHGWDALMPVSAALPPNLYPVIFQQDNANAVNTAAGANATTTNDATSTSAFGANTAFNPNRLTRHMPQFLRPRSASGADATTTASANATADASSTSGKGDPQADASTAGAAATGEEKLASSVNVTVLIAMPSPKTVFPSIRRPLHARSSSRLNGSGILAVAPGNSKLEEVNETGDADSSSDKGKARRAPSLHSIRTTASAKSQVEARREAFFGAQMEDAPLPSVDPRPYDDEEDELPELVFGTASVPLYSKITVSETSDRSMFPSAQRRPLSLIPPTRDELLALMTAASEARTQKPKNKPKDKSKSEDDGDVTTTAGGAAMRQSVAGTSMEGTRGAEDHTISGDALLHNNRGIVEEYEMGTLPRPSMGGIGGTSASFVGDDTRNTEGARLSMSNSVLLSSGAPMGVNDEGASPLDTAARRAGAGGSSMTSVVEHPSASAHSGAMSAHTAREGASSPTNTQTDRQSFTTWHTGDDNDEVAHLAAHAISFDTSLGAATSRDVNGDARA